MRKFKNIQIGVNSLNMYTQLKIIPTVYEYTFITNNNGQNNKIPIYKRR